MNLSTLLSLFFGAVITGAVGLMWWDVRTIRADNKKSQRENKESIQKMIDACHICQLSLPEKYATKVSVDKLWERTDIHDREISWLKAKQNGGH